MSESIDNAATVVAELHAGEKRLVLADSRRTVEALAVGLRARGTTTFLSHSSLSIDERRQAERAFAEARDCVIVSTSTLELGIDVGDLDRVLQVGAPRTVASLLQRLGRSGRRAGTSRSMLFMTTDDVELLRAAGLLQLWSEGYVEPVQPPPTPRHLLAQQLLALCLQHGRVGEKLWTEELHGLALASPEEAQEITEWMLETGHVDRDSGMLFVGPAAERRYGCKNFLELLSVFTADPQFTVLHGRVDVGTVDPIVMTRKVDGPRVLSLGGRSWQVTYIDWKRRRAFVEPSTLTGSSRWSGMSSPLSYALTDAMRRVALGANLGGVSLTRRATKRLAALRDEIAPTVDADASLVLPHDRGGARWWTWAGGRANGVLAAALAEVEPGLVETLSRYDNRFVTLVGEPSVGAVRSAVTRARARFGDRLQGAEPAVSDEALRQLEFAELLPPDLASQRSVSGPATTWGSPCCCHVLLHNPGGSRRSLLLENFDHVFAFHVRLMNNHLGDPHGACPVSKHRTRSRRSPPKGCDRRDKKRPIALRADQLSGGSTHQHLLPSSRPLSSSVAEGLC